jgi:hypothetical protein
MMCVWGGYRRCSATLSWARALVVAASGACLALPCVAVAVTFVASLIRMRALAAAHLVRLSEPERGPRCCDEVAAD